MEIKAELIVKEDTKSFGESGFKKREFVVKYAENPEYPEFVKFELIQDKCELLDKFSIGQEITVSFNLKGRKWTNPKGEDVYFNALQGWRLEASVNGIGDTHPERDANEAKVNEPEWLEQGDKSGVEDPLPF